MCKVNTKVSNCKSACKGFQWQQYKHKLSIAIMHTKVVICNCCIQKLSFAIVAYKSYRSFDAILRFLVWRVSMLNLSQSTLSTVCTIKCIQMKLEYNMRCLKPIGVAVPNLLCTDARYFVFGEETLNGGLVCLTVHYLVFSKKGF